MNSHHFQHVHQRRQWPALIGLVSAMLVAGPAWAQSAGDAALGKQLFENTRAVSGKAFNNDCVGCHVDGVTDRRRRIARSSRPEDSWANISVDVAMSRFQAAVENNAMRQFSTLSAAEALNIAAYLADTPKTSQPYLSFGASAVNTPTAAQHIDLSLPVTDSLSITNVTITDNNAGADAALFTRNADGCHQQVFAANAQPSCRISVYFTPKDTEGRRAVLTITMHQAGSATPFSRTVILDGTVGADDSPGPVVEPPASPDESGGGGLGFAGLALLGLAALRPRRTR